MDQMTSICGFGSPAVVPPLGHVFPVTILMEESLVEKCNSDNLLLLCGAGHPYWQSLVSIDVLLSLPNVNVGSFGVTDVEINDVLSSTKTLLQPSTQQQHQQSMSWQPSTNKNNETPLIFPIEPPPTHIARLVVSQKELSNPLTPITVTMVGRLENLERKTKKLLTGNLLPPFTDSTQMLQSWKDRVTDNEMTVALNFGKLFFQRLGAAQGETAVQNLKEGQAVKIIAQTKVGNRDSLKRWLTEQTFDLEVLEYQILTDNYEDDSSLQDTPLVPFKHRPASHNAPTSSHLSFLTLKDVFGDESGNCITVVDTMESLQRFHSDCESLLANFDNRAVEFMGMDCEWQPNQMSAKGEPQPVLLLQISFVSHGKVYLLDLQSLLRPLLFQTESMNSVEKAFSNTLSLLFLSHRILKTGYQLASDLRRIAASYPHVPCFQDMRGVLEVDSLVKRILQLTKQKKSRAITMSLARLTAHYLGKSVSKECQVSNWSARPLTDAQMEYAALDAVIGPLVAEKALGSINATIGHDSPRIERWDDDEGLAKIIESWKFVVLPENDKIEIDRLNAKNIVGPSWVVSQKWITGSRAPDPPL